MTTRRCSHQTTCSHQGRPDRLMIRSRLGGTWFEAPHRNEWNRFSAADSLPANGVWDAASTSKAALRAPVNSRQRRIEDGPLESRELVVMTFLESVSLGRPIIHRHHQSFSLTIACTSLTASNVRSATLVLNPVEGRRPQSFGRRLWPIPYRDGYQNSNTCSHAT